MWVAYKYAFWADLRCHPLLRNWGVHQQKGCYSALPNIYPFCQACWTRMREQTIHMNTLNTINQTILSTYHIYGNKYYVSFLNIYCTGFRISVYVLYEYYFHYIVRWGAREVHLSSPSTISVYLLWVARLLSIAIAHLFADSRLLSCNTGNRAITSSRNIEEVFSSCEQKTVSATRRQIPSGLAVVIVITGLTLK